MEYVIEIALSLLSAFVVFLVLAVKKINQMDKVLTDHEARIKVEEAKGSSRDTVAADIKVLLHDIANDLSEIKTEQGYWRGRNESQS